MIPMVDPVRSAEYAIRVAPLTRLTGSRLRSDDDPGNRPDTKRTPLRPKVRRETSTAPSRSPRPDDVHLDVYC